MRNKFSRKEQDEIVKELADINAEIQRLEQQTSRSEYQEATLQVMKNRRRLLNKKKESNNGT